MCMFGQYLVHNETIPALLYLSHLSQHFLRFEYYSVYVKESSSQIFNPVCTVCMPSLSLALSLFLSLSYLGLIHLLNPSTVNS